jgi:transposase-like protein
LKNEKRYRCNSCHTAYSVTVNTLFHNTRLPLSKWFSAFNILLYKNKEVSSRELAQILGINKNTAWYLLKRIESGLSNTDDRQLIFSIMEKLGGQNEK